MATVDDLPAVSTVEQLSAVAAGQAQATVSTAQFQATVSTVATGPDVVATVVAVAVAETQQASLLLLLRYHRLLSRLRDLLGPYSRYQQSDRCRVDLETTGT